MKTWYVIPARKDSKGFPFKNRKLFSFTAETIPHDVVSQVIVSTNDDQIAASAEKFRFIVRRRPDVLSNDTASMRDVLLDAIEHQGIKDNDTIILLYLTYPQRTWKDIVKIHDFFKRNNGTALSCCLDVADHPYLCFEAGPGYSGTPILDHPYYRRQDYPECFRLSLFVGIYKAFKVKELSGLLVCKDTIFYKLPKQVIDIDNEIDMVSFHNAHGCR